VEAALRNSFIVASLVLRISQPAAGQPEQKEVVSETLIGETTGSWGYQQVILRDPNIHVA
jgi:hypothetical protein